MIGVYDVAADVDGVAAEAADDRGDDVRVGAEDVEVVVALHAVDLELLDGGVVDVEAGALDAVAS